MASLLLAVVTGESSSAERLRLVVAAYLARYRGLSREHTASDLRVFLTWCGERGLDPLTAQRTHLELYVRWCQEVRRFKPSTVSRRTSAAQRSSLKRFSVVITRVSQSRPNRACFTSLWDAIALRSRCQCGDQLAG